VDGSTANDDGNLLKVGPVSGVVYAAMLGATIAGQLVGIAVDAAIGSHGIWIPAACSVFLEAIVGARMGAARAGRSLTTSESARVSVAYSVALAAVSVPLVVWFAAAGRGGAAALAQGRALGALIWLTALALGTAARWGLMVAFRPRRP